MSLDLAPQIDLCSLKIFKNKPYFDYLGALGASVSLGYFVGGEGPLISKIKKLMGKAS